MSTFTPACELFREIRDIDSMILSMIVSPKTTMWHWPSYYMLYVDVDRLWWLLCSAADSIDHPITDTDDLPMEEYIALTEQDFSALGDLQWSIINWLWKISRNLKNEEGSVKRRLQAHVHPKSDWYQTYRECYGAGHIFSDGKTLKREGVIYFV